MIGKETTTVEGIISATAANYLKEGDIVRLVTKRSGKEIVGFYTGIESESAQWHFDRTYPSQDRSSKEGTFTLHGRIDRKFWQLTMPSGESNETIIGYQMLDKDRKYETIDGLPNAIKHSRVREGDIMRFVCDDGVEKVGFFLNQSPIRGNQVQGPLMLSRYDREIEAVADKFMFHFERKKVPNQLTPIDTGVQEPIETVIGYEIFNRSNSFK